jgi:alpha-1,3-rhamnosyltransferase
MTPPLISVLVPSYNHVAYLEETVRSIWKQQYPALELIIVDDGSTDGTCELAESLKKHSPISMTVIRQDNRGITKTLNRALKLSQGEFVAVIASDDLFAPSRFDAQIELLIRRPSVKVVYGNGIVLGSNRRIHGDVTRGLLKQSPVIISRYLLTNVSPLYTQTCLFRRQLLDQIGGWDEELLSDDWALNIRVFKHLVEYGGEHAFLDDDVVFYRLHSGNSWKNSYYVADLTTQIINKYTPFALQREAFANVYWRIGLSEFRFKRYRSSAKYLLKSQKTQFRPRIIIEYVSKIPMYFLRRWQKISNG